MDVLNSVEVNEMEGQWVYYLVDQSLLIIYEVWEIITELFIIYKIWEGRISYNFKHCLLMSDNLMILC